MIHRHLGSDTEQPVPAAHEGPNTLKATLHNENKQQNAPFRKAHHQHARTARTISRLSPIVMPLLYLQLFHFVLPAPLLNTFILSPSCTAQIPGPALVGGSVLSVDTSRDAKPMKLYPDPPPSYKTIVVSQ